MIIAILGVLIFIAVILAPWLISVAIALIAVGGVALAIAAAIAAVCVIIGIIWRIGSVLIKDQQEKPQVIRGERVACPFCQCEMSINAFLCKNCGN